MFVNLIQKFKQTQPLSNMSEAQDQAAAERTAAAEKLAAERTTQMRLQPVWMRKNISYKHF